MADESSSREDRVFLAKLAEQAERYEDMVQYMKSVASDFSDLSIEERNLFSVAYKNVVGRHRASWRQLSAVRAKDKDKGKSGSEKTLDDYITAVAKDLKGVCTDVLKVLEENLISSVPADDNEALVFYQKMKGDYFRYLAEFQEGDQKKQDAEDALKAYQAASDTANKLPSTNPIRLGLALNCSVFYYEILDNPEKACKLAKEAFDAAIAELDALTEDSYKDSTLIMQLLRDNLTLWTSDMQDEDEGGNKGDTQVEDIEQDAGS